MTYTRSQWEEIITDRDEELMEEYRDFVPMFDLMKEGFPKLSGKSEGAEAPWILSSRRVRFTWTEKESPYAIKPYRRNPATKLIEDFMLTANGETVAEDFYWQEIPFVYLHP